jgi:hypothetical protein
LLDHLLGDRATAGRAMISAVHGLGGLGKTTIARWLVWRPEIERRFPDGRIWVTLGNEPPDALTIINDCIGQLDAILNAKATLEAARSELATLSHDKSILFVIDDVWPGRSTDVAKALLVPSSRSCFLLTTRFSRLADDPGIRAANFPLDEMNVAQAKELISRALRRELSPSERPFAERLCEVVGGHPLALELIAARVREGRLWNALLADLSAEIARLEALEEVDDDLIETPILDKAREKQNSVRASLMLSVRSLRDSGRQLFARLGIISEDATISAEMAATLWETNEETASRHLRSLQGAGILKADDSTYHLHDLMHDLAREILTAPVTPPQERDIPGLGLTLQDASRQLLNRYRVKTNNGLWHTLSDDGYIHDHLFYHFHQARLFDELDMLLWEESSDGRCGWYWARERLGQTPGFISDVNRVWSYADRAVATAKTESDRARAIALQLHCALIISSINSLSAGIPAEVLAGAVECGLIAFPTALTFARQHPNARSKVSALSVLADAISSEQRAGVLDEALTTAQGIDNTRQRANALADVAQRLPAQEALVVLRSIDSQVLRCELSAVVAGRMLPDDALIVARSIDDKFARSQSLAEVASRLPPEDGLVVAHSIDDQSRRNRALVEIVSRLPPKDGLVVARSIDDQFGRSRALAEIARRLPPKDALVVARNIEDQLIRDLTLAEVASRLPPEEALAVPRNINHQWPRDVPMEERLKFEWLLIRNDDQESRAYRMVELAAGLPAEQRAKALEMALSAARESSYGRARAQALMAVARRLPPEQQAKVLSEALGTARDVYDARVRAWLLGLVAQQLSREQQAAVLGEALAATQNINDGQARAEALAAVAQRLLPVEALAIARQIYHARERARSLVVVAQRLPSEQQSGVLSEALSAAQDIDDARMRARTLAAVSSHLPAEQRARVLDEALEAARGITPLGTRAQALAGVAQHLPPEEALAVARGIDNAGMRAQALVGITQRLPPAKALELARAIGDPAPRARALAAVAQRLPAAKALEVVKAIDHPGARAEALARVAHRLPIVESLAVARGIDHPRWRAEALAAVAARLPTDVHQGVLNEALSAARGVADAAARAQALATVAEVLPPEDALSVIRDIGEARVLVQAIARVATRLSPDEALVLARGIDDTGARACALAAIAQRLSVEQRPQVLSEAWALARSIDNARARARALAGVARWPERPEMIDFSQWAKTVRVLAMRERRDCITDFTAIIPLIGALGARTALRSVARSIISVGRWWPSQPRITLQNC